MGGGLNDLIVVEIGTLSVGMVCSFQIGKAPVATSSEGKKRGPGGRETERRLT